MDTTATTESRTAPELPDRMIHARDLAEILGVKLPTIWAWARSGRLPACHPSLRLMWHPDVIAEFLKGQATPEPRPATTRADRKPGAGRELGRCDGAGTPMNKKKTPRATTPGASESVSDRSLRPGTR